MTLLQLRDERAVYWIGDESDAIHDCPICGHHFVAIQTSLLNPDTIYVICPAVRYVDKITGEGRICGYGWTKERKTVGASGDTFMPLTDFHQEASSDG